MLQAPFAFKQKRLFDSGLTVDSPSRGPAAPGTRKN